MSEHQPINWDLIVAEREAAILRELMWYISDQREIIDDYPLNSKIIYKRFLETFLDEYARQRMTPRENIPDKETLTQFVKRVLKGL